MMSEQEVGVQNMIENHMKLLNLWSDFQGKRAKAKGFPLRFGQYIDGELPQEFTQDTYYMEDDNNVFDTVFMKINVATYGDFDE